ncbi:MAG: N-6 DNA methylase [Sulfolobales archaeon]
MNSSISDTERKNLGQYFTPIEVARFMCSLITKPKNAVVLEPCAGTGVFLTVLHSMGFRNIAAYEIDSTLPNYSPVKIEYMDFLTIEPVEKFDVVVGNPPYVRWRNIPKKWREVFRRSPYWSRVINGLSDLTYAFIYHSVNMLKPGGELVFITPVFWMETVHGSKLRKHLLERGHLELVVNFNEMKIFDEVSSTIVVFKYVKSRENKPIKVVRVHSKDKLTVHHLAKVQELLRKLETGVSYVREGVYEAFMSPQFRNGEPWLPVPRAVVKKNPLLRSNPAEHSSRIVLLGEIAEIGNGMVSGLDEAFRLSRHELRDLNPAEKEHIILVYKAHTLDRFYPTSSPVPYIYVNDVESEEKLRSMFPHFYSKLLPYRTRLLARYNYGKNIPWWHWVFPRNKHLFERYVKKILVPSKERYDTRGYYRFTYVKGLYYATQDVTAVCPKPSFREGALYLLALLNSEAYQEYILHKGFTRGGVYDFSEEPLSRIPVIRVDWNSVDERRTHEDIVNLVNEIIGERNWRKHMGELNTLVSKLIHRVLG